MALFPHLSSGAVCQHPAQITHQQAVQVLRYLDGSDQRFLTQGRQFRSWEIQLNLLNEAEMIALEKFFQAQLGDYATFDFPDPFNNRIVPNCCLGDSVIVSEFFEHNRCATSLRVVETHG